MSKTVVGLDIGNSSLKIAYRKGKQGIVTDSVKLPENLVKNGRVQVLQAMADCLRQLRRERRLPRNAYYAMVLPESAVICRRMTLPYMTREQLTLNLPYEFRDFITDEGDRYYYDYALERIVNDDAGNPRSMELFAAAALKNVVAEHRDLCRMAGLKLRILQPREIIWNTLLSRCIGEDAVGEGREFCIVDMGQRVTRVMFYRGSIFRASRSIDMGSADIDEAISMSRNVDLHLAQTYKETNYEGALEDEGCLDTYHRIALEIRRAINFYRFSEPESTLEDLYFAGGSACIAALYHAVAEGSGLTMHSVTELLPAELSGENTGACALAVGLSLCGREVLDNV